MSTTRTMSIALTEALRDFVAQRVSSGVYGDESEYIRDLIRKDQDDQHRRTLRALLEEGLTSGPATAFTPNDWEELDAIAAGRIQ